MDYILYTDGASRGNPGPAAVGGALFKKGQEEPCLEVYHTIGIATNNVAEYQAVIDSLEQCISTKLPIQHLQIYLDSELIVKQIQGKYKVKNANLYPLYKRVRALLAQLPKYNIAHVKRSENMHADRLANKALDTKRLSTHNRPHSAP